MTPYRTAAAAAPAASVRERLTCMVLGHRWFTFKVHNALMAHLGPTAGVDARCLRCGRLSMWTGTRYDDEET